MGGMVKTLGKVAGAPLGAIPVVGKKLKKASNKIHGIKKKGPPTVLSDNRFTQL